MNELLEGKNYEDAKVAWKEAKGSLRGFDAAWKSAHKDDEPVVKEEGGKFSVDVGDMSPEQVKEKLKEATDNEVVAAAVPEAADELIKADKDDEGDDTNVVEEAPVKKVNEDFDMFWNTTGLTMLRHGHSPKSLIQRVLAIAGNGCTYQKFVASIGPSKFKEMVSGSGRNNPGSIEELSKLAWECPAK